MTSRMAKKRTLQRAGFVYVAGWVSQNDAPTVETLIAKVADQVDDATNKKPPAMTAEGEVEQMNNRYYARSASDHTDDWPYWFVADKHRGGLNVTSELMRKLNPDEHRPGGVFMCVLDAKALATLANDDDVVL